MKRKISKISILHYYKLIFRSALFLAALVLYIVNQVRANDEPFGGAEHIPGLMIFIWVIFVIEMILRFFPSRLESMGCQKQFAHNYRPTAAAGGPRLLSGRTTLLIALGWLAMNGIIGLLYWLGWIDRGILFLVALAYSVCDMICILFFCPFQTWFMKNKCCGSCRIYNWDYAMMFTPLVFIPGWYTWGLLGIALALLMVWEILVWRHPERFSEVTNQALACANCPEKLCHHKRQLQGFIAKNRDLLRQWRETE